jgi:NAD(P)-dependent dehydrogenase (short-subunit alcohol dehydrogenase family)
LRDRGIRVNPVSPGATDTPGIDIVARMLFEGPNAEQEFEDYQRSIVPMGRYGTPEEVANAALFLASDLSTQPPRATAFVHLTTACRRANTVARRG